MAANGSNHADLALSLVRMMNSSEVRANLRANVPAKFPREALAAPAAGSSSDGRSSCYWSYVKGSQCLTEPGTHKGGIIGNLLWVSW
eukprot:1176305-Prorocentrum_minimum.AAC.2